VLRDEKDMRTTRPRTGQQSNTLGYGPQLGFTVAVIAGFAAWSGLVVPIPAHFGMPLLATLFLIFAAVFGVIAWRRHQEDPARVTYADVAGALTLIGLFAACTIDPDQLVRIVADGRTRD
jgi:hypothetical protein